jgi:nucleoside-diphosphate-sugar epimerase
MTRLALSPMAASFFSECRRVSNARAKAMLGWRPAYPDAVAGLRAMLSA